MTTDSEHSPALSSPSRTGEPAEATLRVGRDPANDLVVPELIVSRFHAELRRFPDGTTQLVDLGSHNGTFVNGQRIAAANLLDLDLVSFAGSQFRFVHGTLSRQVEPAEVAFAALGVSAGFGDHTLVHDVSFPLQLGSLLAIVGPSGAGKSSLLNVLTGLRQPMAGTVYFAGRDLHAGYSELKGRIGFVPQDDIVHPDLTVVQSLEFAADLRFAPDVTSAERKARIVEVLEELELSHRRDVQVRKLSGGERKRVSVGLELLTQPTLLLLDEPTSGLDPGRERNLMELLRRLADGGRVVVVVTHSVDSIRLCDRVLFLAPGGRVAYFAPPSLAHAYFERDDYQEIFRDLSERDPQEWNNRFQADSISRHFVSDPLKGYSAAPADSARKAPQLTPQRWARQFSMLTRRNVRVLAADRVSVSTMLLAGPLLGLLALWRLPTNELAKLPVFQLRLLSQASLVLFVVMLCMTLLGLSNGIREISKESKILNRELAVGLSPSAYMFSKALYLGVITILQAVILVPIALARQGGPPDALLLGSPLLEIVVAAALAGTAALALALFVSAALRSTAAALASLPLLLAFQVLFGSAGLFPGTEEQPVLREVGYASSAGWGFAAAASTSELNELQRSNNTAAKIPVVRLDQPEQAIRALLQPESGPARFNHTRKAWLISAGALVGITVLCFVGAGLAVRRMAPG
ncbi:MAG: ATP-binding cassette domain-containing protein [Dehalococcoidia bacterium]